MHTFRFTECGYAGQFTVTAPTIEKARDLAAEFFEAMRERARLPQVIDVEGRLGCEDMPDWFGDEPRRIADDEYEYSLEETG